MKAGGTLLRNPLIRLMIFVGVIMLVTQPRLLESVIIFLFTGMIGIVSIPPMVMLVGYVAVGIYTMRLMISQLSVAKK